MTCPHNADSRTRKEFGAALWGILFHRRSRKRIAGKRGLSMLALAAVRQIGSRQSRGGEATCEALDWMARFFVPSLLILILVKMA